MFPGVDMRQQGDAPGARAPDRAPPSLDGAGARRAAVGIAALATFLLGCFDPKIVSGNLHCAPQSNACPGGFVCSGGVCVTRGDAAADGVTDGKPADGTVADMLPTDAVSTDAVVCPNPVVPLCTPAAGVTGLCDPVCQTGCPCGQRCGVSTNGSFCLAQAGVKTVGQVCSPSTDDCAPGYACLREACGSNLGRCYRFCRDASMCGAGVACSTQVNSSSDVSLGRLACDLAEQTCDPIAGTGCPDPALSCFVTAVGHTICDCPGRNRREGDSCRGYDDCAQGLACLDSTCVRLCRSTNDCLDCVALGTIRYCKP